MKPNWFSILLSVLLLLGASQSHAQAPPRRSTAPPEPVLEVRQTAVAAGLPAVENRHQASSQGINQSGKRIALVIGNDAYQKVSKLEKAGNDATAMARELKAAGFDVVLHKDLNYRAMVKAVETLSNSITGGDQVVVFFAGHGVQIKTGNYLLPVDIEASSESEIEKTAYSLADLTDKLSEAKASFALVLVDACRDNPIKSKGRSVGNSRGLSAIEPPKGQIVVFSASKGQQALDRLSDNDSNPNGVFTREFIKRMKLPGVRIEDMMREVQDSVETLAQSISHDQRPAVYNEARGNFYFFGPSTVNVQGGTKTADPETQTWDAAQSVNSAAAYQTYLDSYPQGRFVGAAKIKLGALMQTGAATGVPLSSIRPESVKLTAQPGQGSSVSLDDLEKEESVRKQWTQWQARMKADFDKTAAFQGSTDLQAKAWERFLAAWAQDNPLSREDDTLRERAKAELGRKSASVQPQPVLGQESEAVARYRSAAVKGDASAQWSLGWAYANGEGVAKDEREAVIWYRKAAEQGLVNAQYGLGLRYENGQGVAKDPVQANAWYRKAAEKGYAYAQAALGANYKNGLGFDKDYAQALIWYRKAADQGSVSAQYGLGLMYENGQGVVKDAVQANAWYRKAADQGYVYGQFALGLNYKNGFGVDKDYTEALIWYRRAADQGFVNAQYGLGLMYENGQGVVKDAVQANAWYRKAADKGYANAQHALGINYKNGFGVDKDNGEALVWYRKAADQGFASAQHGLGMMYKNGQGVTKDEREAVNWYRKAADQGLVNAQYGLGLMYENGQGVAKDEREANAWYRKAADQNYALAQLALGMNLKNGLGVTKDEREAVIWYRKAADQGDSDAQYGLGQLYANGRGVSKDEREAMAWYRKAADQGHVEAKRQLAVQ